LIQGSALTISAPLKKRRGLQVNSDHVDGEMLEVDIFEIVFPIIIEENAERCQETELKLPNEFGFSKTCGVGMALVGSLPEFILISDPASSILLKACLKYCCLTKVFSGTPLWLGLH
jgi:hypothetical protein